jgi:hypothetical protein
VTMNAHDTRAAGVLVMARCSCACHNLFPIVILEAATNSPSVYYCTSADFEFNKWAATKAKR